MKTFLEYVAGDIIAKHGTNLSRIAVVFPNKRASLFLNEHLARYAGRPLWSPVYMTISELFQSHSDLRLCDSIKLVADLHKCFTACTGSGETLDHFYGWGELLLSDFDDIDKNMADAAKVFMNVHHLYELDDLSYLDDSQVDILRRFFSNFSRENNTELKRRFLELWNNMYEIYSRFNDHLRRQGLGYEGAISRSVVTDDSVTFEYDTYIFVGFNLLNRVEQQLFTRLKKDGRALFYWDFDHYYMPHAPHPALHNEAGHYISSFLSAFPNELDNRDGDIYENFSKPKTVTYISARTEDIQARYVSTWLREGDRIAAGRRTAIVLCNEGLLQTVVHCLPDGVNHINITTGYPLIQSPVASLLRLLISLKTTGYVAHADKYRLNSVNAVLNHPYMRYISDGYGQLYDRLNVESKVYYPDVSQLVSDDGTALLFANLTVEDGPSLTAKLSRWLMKITEMIAHNAAGSDDQFFNEAIFRTYTILNRVTSLLESGDIDIDIVTFQRLLNQLIRATSVPFHGEPIAGIQVMGVLETRNLDFDHLLILSANEGNMPKGINDTSFIPYNIRKAHGLTTIDNKVAIYSYYFYRLLQRAGDVTIAYNSATENGSTGEMSRFMLQILVESGHTIARRSLQAGQKLVSFSCQEVAKTPRIMELLLNRFDKFRREPSTDMPLLTPTAINRYMRCPKQFYYNYVCGIREPDTTDEDKIDNRIFGNIFHSASQKIYERLTVRSPHIHATDIQTLLDSRTEIASVVDEAFREELFRLPPDSRFRPEYDGLQIINREVIITYVRKLLLTDLRLTPFDIIGLEIDAKEEMEIHTEDVAFTTIIGGRIDRLDCINDGEGERIRVIDYKTGGRLMRPLAMIDDVFDTSKIHSNHSDYYLQAMLYSGIVRNSSDNNPRRLPVSPALLFIQRSSGEDYDPTLCFGNEKIKDVAKFKFEFDGMLRTTVNEIFSASVPFRPTPDEDICRTCPYLKLCGK